MEQIQEELEGMLMQWLEDNGYPLSAATFLGNSFAQIFQLWHDNANCKFTTGITEGLFVMRVYDEADATMGCDCEHCKAKRMRAESARQEFDLSGFLPGGIVLQGTNPLHVSGGESIIDRDKIIGRAMDQAGKGDQIIRMDLLDWIHYAKTAYPKTGQIRYSLSEKTMGYLGKKDGKKIYLK